MLLLHVIKTFPTWSFETLTRKLPQPIHKTASLPISVRYAFPRMNSEEAVQKQHIQTVAYQGV